MLDFELNAEHREAHGKAAARRFRRLEDKVPAVVYGAGQDPESLTLSHNDVLKAFKHEAVFSHILKLNVNGKAQSVVLKAIQRHPSKPKIMHIDFLRVKADEAIIMHVPLHFVGEDKAPGVRSGGAVTKHFTDIEIKCLPRDLPEFIEMDISALELGAALHLSDIPLPKGVKMTHGEITEENDQPVVSIHMPKVSLEAEEALEAAEAEAKAAAEEATEEAAGEEAAPEAGEQGDEGEAGEASAPKE